MEIVRLPYEMKSPAPEAGLYYYRFLAGAAAATEQHDPAFLFDVASAGSGVYTLTGRAGENYPVLAAWANMRDPANATDKAQVTSVAAGVISVVTEVGGSAADAANKQIDVLIWMARKVNVL